MNLPELSVAASSNARMNSPPLVPSPPRQSGSTLKATLHILSNANLSNMSCKSNTCFVFEALARTGTNLVEISTSTLSMTKFRSDFVLNS
ncbi:hypothetical protein OIU77_018045 [Salix suchowensis]|uniref:Uncharacterized protein n=1 Tax=Salix suchowensis TaxID=1278906 RepID=A0ABQ8ZRE9_9ROSI|nr:hypothetical protein OIU77_018045 [Salix suchowensis]